MVTVFLDTTIQIDRLWGTRHRRRTIRLNLADKRVCTSSYVLMEFQRTLLKDLSYVHSLVRTDCEIGSDGIVFLSDLLRRLSQRSGQHTDRSVKRTQLVVARIMDFFQNTKVSRSELMEFLEQQTEDIMEEFFEVDLVADGGGLIAIEHSDATDCDLVKDHLAPGDARRFYCRRDRAKCQLPQFLGRHAETLKKIQSAFQTSEKSKGSGKSDARMSASADRVLNQQPIDWQVVKGQKNCWPLGDTIIALEAPVHAAIYTTDGHFDVICPIVRRTRYKEESLVQTPAPPPRF